MEGPQLAQILAAWGAPLILPLAVVEGPLVAIAAGFLAARDYLDWRWALALLICGDLLGDILCYALGRFGRAPFNRLARRFGQAGTQAFLHRLKDNPVKMLLIGKWTHAIGALVLIAAGMIRLPLSLFTAVNVPATVPKCAALLAIGYFATDWVLLAEQHMLTASALLLALGAGAILLLPRRGANGISP